MTRAERQRTLKISGAMLAVQLLLFTPFACSSAAHPAVTVADVVNEVALRGDASYAVTVEQCNEGEKRAAEIPDLDAAKVVVARIRSTCDVAFRAFEKVRSSIDALDSAVASAEQGKITARELAELAVVARQRVEQAIELGKAAKTVLEVSRGAE